MEYSKASELPFDPRQQMGRIFATGFYQWLKHFSKDVTNLAEAFAHIFELEHFYVAVQNGEIAAIVACTAGKPSPIRLDRKTLCRTLGFFRGNMACAVLTKSLINHVYPFELSGTTGTIEFVATAPEHRGKGVAGELITHVMDVMPFADYVLEVVDTNVAAVRLYEKLGFREFKRTPSPWGSGFNHFVYMIREKDGAR